MTTSSLAVEIVGHRGASHDAPENTLASVNLAWEQGADAVEIDVYLTRDGKIVAIHDKTTKRYGGPDKDVVSQSFEELRSLDVGRWKAEKWAGEQIPTLTEVLDTIPPDKRLFIEIKSDGKIIPELKRVLKKHAAKPKQAALIGFSLATMRAAKMTLPERQVYWIKQLKQEKSSKKTQPTAESLVRTAHEAHLDGVDLGNTPLITQSLVDTVKQAGLGIYVWTVNSPKEAQRLQQLEIDGITTDRPGWLRKQLTPTDRPQSTGGN